MVGHLQEHRISAEIKGVVIPVPSLCHPSATADPKSDMLEETPDFKSHCCP